MTEKIPVIRAERAAGIWKCESDYDKRHRYKLKPSCGRWNFIWTTRRDGNKSNRWLGKCPACGKKRSMTGAITGWHFTKEAAQAEIDSLNGVI